MVDAEEFDVAQSRVGRTTPETTDSRGCEDSTNGDRDLPWCGCASGQPDLALDEKEIGPARVQVLWCARCETILTTISEVPQDD